MRLWRPLLPSGPRAVSPGLALGAVALAAIVAAALGADLLAPYSPTEQFRDAIRVPPAWQAGGSTRFLLGTDDVGRDMVSRLVHGARTSLLIGGCVAVLSVGAGMALGLAAAFGRPALGFAIMRCMDVILSTPGLLLAMIVIAILGPSLANSIAAITLIHLPNYVRLVRATALAERSREYVTAARALGAGPWRIALATVLPNCMGPITVQATLGVSTAILEAAALGFIGLGVQAPTAEWGTMLATSREQLESAPWIVTLPGLAILATVLAVNLVGDGLRDRLDPRMHRI